MIDKIVEMIMEEARSRPGNDLVMKIYDVDIEVRTTLYDIMDKHKAIERRKKEDENKRSNP